jgi:hypothetical protein
MLVAIPVALASCTTAGESTADKNNAQTFWGGLSGTHWGITCNVSYNCENITPPFTWRL